ncbi:NAD-dependent epimerase/dehydratase family protein [Allorhizocola rhizosphaerae]|uniref:NAD-dependent epimerase/dehydratase family protein n=1 Tax=Allorhizocola rhizosphaerae TaxID=1872709 RepID=UPI000E3BE5A2|nr:NAD-dependent epimerase/dehydratase family protein [Allorhizocola rhizosphaerae]
MSLQLIVGAGSTGSATATQLAEAGDQVRIVSRRGGGPDHPNIERVAADATDTETLATLAKGAATLFNTAMPGYDRWPQDWPPLAASMLAAAERTGASYVMLGNTYGYGRVVGQLTEDLPMAPISVKGRVRARMWHDALEAHQAGRVRVTEVRGNHFVGPATVSLFTLSVAPEILAGRAGWWPGDLDAPYSWTYTGDAAATLVAASRSEAAWGQAWHVPSFSELSVRELTGVFAELAGVREHVLRELSNEELWALARKDAIAAEFREMRYLLDLPELLDSTKTQEVLGVKPSTIDSVLLEMISG